MFMLLLRPMLASMFLSPPETMLTSVGHAASMGHVFVMTHVAFLGSMLLSVACDAARGYECACSPSCLHKLCGSPSSVLPLTVKDKKATFAMPLMTVDSQLRES